MAANGSGLQWSTVRNMLMAWVLTLPAPVALRDPAPGFLEEIPGKARRGFAGNCVKTKG
jgi:hypothetical protein